MNDTVALHMFNGDVTKTTEFLANAEKEFNNAQKRTQVAEGVMQALQNKHVPQVTIFGDESSLSDSEKEYINTLIDKGITEFELRQLDSELSILLHGRSPEILSHTITKVDGTKVETIAKGTICPETFDMKISPFTIAEFAQKRDTYNALEYYIRSRMEEEGYRYVLKTSSFPGTLRFGKESFEYRKPEKVETDIIPAS